MMILYWLVEIAASFVEQFVLYRILAMVFQKQQQKMFQSVIAAGSGAALIVACNQISLFSYFTIAVLFACICIGSLLIYRENVILIFSICCFYILCMGCFDFFVATLISNFKNGEYLFSIILAPGMPRILFIIMIKAIWISVYFLLKRFFCRVNLHKKNISAMLVVSVGGYVGFVYLVNQTFTSLSSDMAELWFFMLSILILLLFVFCFYIEIRSKKTELDYEHMRNILLEEKYQEVNDIYGANAKLYHDLNNHLNVMYQLINKESINEAKKYIREISQPVQNLSKTVWTGIDIVDVIINSKIDKMNKLGISYTINAEFPQNTNIASNDICTIISNLLDNAIEAAKKVQDRGESISIIIRKIKYFLVIQITNPCIDDIANGSVLPVTTKKDKKMHGWGLPSTVSIIEKYGGTFEYKNKNGSFTATALLFFERIIN